MLSEDGSELYFTEEDLDAIRKELERRCDILVKYAEDQSRQMDGTDRQHILLYLRDKNLPGHPNTIPHLMKNFASSGLSYSITRKYLGSFIGSFPTPETIDLALRRLFDEGTFENEDNWYPEKLGALIDNVCDERGWNNNDLGQKTADSRILGVLKDGALWFEKALADGLDPYFLSVKKHLNSPEEAWDYLTGFKNSIRQLGEALAADYLKNAGFHQFVKPDIHLLREFPQLIGLPQEMKAREVFIIGWRLSEVLEVPAFYLDHVLYQWGRYGNRSASQTAPQTNAPATQTATAAEAPKRPQSPQNLRPESIGISIYHGRTLEEIKKTNRFALKSWLNDPAELSRTRSDAIEALFSGRREVPLADIQNRTQNEGKYAAFRAIAHGIARWDDANEKLIRK